MGLIKHNGKIEWVDKESVYRMSGAEAVAYVAFTESRITNLKSEIATLYDLLNTVKQVHGIDDYYPHTVEWSTAYDKLGGEHDD